MPGKPNGPNAHKRFVIKVGDTYYMTNGALLVYDPKEAQKQTNKAWKAAMTKGVADMAQKFQEVHDAPNTWYPAVDFSDVAFSGVNTGDDD